jgi:hypothetical protein
MLIIFKSASPCKIFIAPSFNILTVSTCEFAEGAYKDFSIL